MRDVALVDRLKALVGRDVTKWMPEGTRYGAAPAIGESGQAALPFQDDAEAARFEAQWLGTGSGAAG